MECSGKKVDGLERVKFLMAPNSISIRGRVVFKIYPLVHLLHDSFQTFQYIYIIMMLKTLNSHYFVF